MTGTAIPELGLTTSLCLPSSCSKNDVFIMVQNSKSARIRQIMNISVPGLKLYPFLHIIEDLHADMEQTISFEFKVKNLRTIQIWALVFTSLCVSMVLLSLLLDFQGGTLKYFDPRENTRMIFYVRKGERKRSLFVDLNKTIVVLVAIIMHIITCADAPRSTAYFSHISFARELMSNIVLQVITFEGGFNALAFLSGLNTFEEVHHTIQGNRTYFCWLLFNKWLRYIPAFISLMSLELVWPLLANGPLWNETAELHLNKIENHWWKVLTYTNNFVPFEYQPIAHTNFSMIDFQLYFLGLIGVYLLCKSNRRGFIFAAVMILSGYISLGLHVWIFDVQPHFLHPSVLLR